MNKIYLLLMLSPLKADQTAKGKIIFTQGHYVPDCRVVKHQENISGIERTFRIQDVAGDDDINAVLLSALMASRDVVINYDLGVTTGCGTEPRLSHVTVY